MDQFLINSRLYSWSDITALILNHLLIGIKAINYKDNVVHEDAMGQGSVPVGYTTGPYKAEASVVLLMSEVQALRNASVDGRLTSIRPFVWTIAYLNEDQIPVKHSFMAKFTNDEAGGDNGSSGALETKLELKVVGRINWKA